MTGDFPSQAAFSRRSALVLTAVLAAAALLAGCAPTTVTAEEFLKRYQTDIEVPDTDSPVLPARLFLGRREGYYRMREVIPTEQGGGFWGTDRILQTPVSALPAEFPNEPRPAVTLMDGRRGARYRYMIQWYRQQ
jgi:hypothetical protein